MTVSASPSVLQGDDDAPSERELLKEALATQGRVIGALLLREARTRFGRMQLGYVWALVEPTAMIASFTFVSYAFGHLPPYGNSIAMFHALGTVGYNFYRRVATFCATAIDANQALLSYPIVRRFDTLVARMLLEVLTFIVVTVLVIGGLIVWIDQPLPAHIEYMFISIVLMSLLGFGHGTISGVITHFWPTWHIIDTLLARPMFMLSGIWFVIDRIPPFARPLMDWNPIVHGVELIRYGYYSEYRSPAMSIAYLASWGFGLTLIGLAAERAIRVRSTMTEAGGG